MPQVDFILGTDAFRQLVGKLLAGGVTIVPSLRYHTEAFMELRDAEDVLRVSSSGDLMGPLLLLSPEFTLAPPEMKSIEWRGKTWHTVNHRYGGPYLDMLPCREKLDQTPPLLTSGFIAYYPSYYLEGGGRTVPVPDSLKALYRAVAASIRGMCRKFVTEKVGRTYWVHPAVIDRCRGGLDTNVPGLQKFASLRSD